MSMTSPPRLAAIPDAPAGNWVDRYAPAATRPYLKLMRADRSIGTWLLLFPCWWGQLLAENAAGATAPNLWFMALFAIGAFVMRGAGCTYNDYIDRDIDGRVARTASRPIPSGQVRPRQALAFAVALSFVGLAVLVQFNTFTIWLAIASLGLVAIYPFMKRVMNWPQLVLGLVFKWGALVGWAAVTGSLDGPAIALYAGCVLWTIGYDTIYAHQDKEDDALLGLKSTALRFGAHTEAWLAGLFLGAVVLWGIAGAMIGGSFALFAALVVVAAHFAWQISTLETDDPANCLQRFRSNRHVGWLLLAGLLGDMLLFDIH
jgi:4-hydroxybenzoate polyprenyltransferase